MTMKSSCTHVRYGSKSTSIVLTSSSKGYPSSMTACFFTNRLGIRVLPFLPKVAREGWISSKLEMEELRVDFATLLLLRTRLFSLCTSTSR